MATKITTGLIANDAITSAHIGATAITHADLHTNMDLTGKTVLVANASTGDNDTTAANTAFVQQELAALVDSAPGTLNTLNELAAALGDDAAFSTTVTNSIATKLPLAGGTLTGNLIGTTATFSDTVTIDAADGDADEAYVLAVRNQEATAGRNYGLWVRAGSNSSDESFSVRNFDNSSVYLKIRGDGNVGIGTGTPASILDIRTANTASGSDFGTTAIVTRMPLVSGYAGAIVSGLGFYDNTIHSTDIGYAYNRNSTGGYDLVFSTNDDTNGNPIERMTINADGLVGIGTSNPTSHYGFGRTLEVQGSANAEVNISQTDHGKNWSLGIVNGTNYQQTDNSKYMWEIGGNSYLSLDTTGIHFERADGQLISAKESISIKIDEDNNTASRVFQVIHGNGKTLLNLHDDYRGEYGTIHHAGTRTAGYGQSNGLGASAGDWVDIATVPYGRNIATIKLFWDGIYAPSSSHHGNMEFDIGSHYGTSYYYGWDSYINLKASSAHNGFYITEARIITPNGSGATGHFQVKFGVATGTQGTLRSYVTFRDEQCSISPMTPAVNNSRSGTTIAALQLGDNGGFINNRVSLATSRDMHIGGGLTIATQPSVMAHKSGHYMETTGVNNVTGWVTQHNVGGDFVASTGVFTCPTAGRYLCTFSPMSGQTSGDVQFRIYRNSSLLLGSNSMAQGGGPWRQTTVTGVIDCDAGDTLRPKAYSSATSSTVHQVYTGGYSTLSFHFLG